MFMHFTDYDSSIHCDSEQIKRIKSASASKLTPLVVDYTNNTGVFQGSSSKYDVSLEFCPCGDYRRRKLPCKHIYRLAMELGLFQCDFSSDVSQSKSRVTNITFSDYIDLVENLSEESQKLLLSDLYIHLYKKSSYCCHPSSSMSELFSSGIVVDCGIRSELLDFFTRNELNELISKLDIPFKKNMSQSTLVAWCKDNLSNRYDELFCGYSSTKINDDYAKHNSKLYKYLHRKYDYESFWDGESSSPTDIRLLDTELPDDIVTEQLIRKGFYNR